MREDDLKQSGIEGLDDAVSQEEIDRILKDIRRKEQSLSPFGQSILCFVISFITVVWAVVVWVQHNTGKRIGDQFWYFLIFCAFLFVGRLIGLAAFLRAKKEHRIKATVAFAVSGMFVMTLAVISMIIWGVSVWH